LALLLLLQSFTLLREMLAAFGQLGQADRASLVGVQQTFIGACGPVQPGAQLLLGGLLPGGAGIGGGEAVELRQELVRVGQQGHDMVPHDRLDLFGVEVAAGADAGSRHHDAILAVASVDLPHGLSRRRGAGDAIHGQPAGLADEQAAQQVAMPLDRLRRSLLRRRIARAMVLLRNESAALRASWACAWSHVPWSTRAGTGMAIHCSRGLRQRRVAAAVRGPRWMGGLVGATWA